MLDARLQRTGRLFKNRSSVARWSRRTCGGRWHSWSATRCGRTWWNWLSIQRGGASRTGAGQATAGGRTILAGVWWRGDVARAADEPGGAVRAAMAAQMHVRGASLWKREGSPKDGGSVRPQVETAVVQECARQAARAYRERARWLKRRILRNRQTAPSPWKIRQLPVSGCPCGPSPRRFPAPC